MRLRLACCVIALSLAACSGIPLRSIPRLLSLQHTLLDMNPAEFMLAIQADARMIPPAGAVPVMNVAVRPRVEGAFDTMEKALPLRFTVFATDANRPKGLAPAPAQRRWLIYSFTLESQAELLRIQNEVKRLRALPAGKSGGSISVGIAQEGVAAKDPALANTRWESWLQTSAREGFYELWSGTLAALLKQAQTKSD
jgi:hypothetical protein